ncbi:molybdate ABC transporter permease subunit [Echinicola vietnamensis]|uniref:Molybdenum transport system permease n=1 Tax=Echinicola vietnamensis (strain DSM 17526 / LMG 23754 / KMM 6221) TaxID=926556 RepID=L0G2U6_ECHVK|nr:molybdate ABC transporter permease subunit [Echinicola vietnamensis]AGA79867.1 molybdate ABC transporter, permease protein [Echinicola vietnamensis DSM 17526]
MNWFPIILTLKLALVTTVILFIVALPLAYWLSETRIKVKPVVEALVSMPLVLPPTVLGFYLLVAFSPQNAFGHWLEKVLDIKLVFTFSGIVLASCLYSLPFMVQPLQSGLASIPTSIKEASLLMGKSKWTILRKVLLPNIKPSVLTACVLTFAHTMGEFGVVLMIGGNIPEKTKVASIAVYDEVESLNYAAANQYAIILVLLSFITLLCVYFYNGSYFKTFTK